MDFKLRSLVISAEISSEYDDLHSIGTNRCTNLNQATIADLALHVSVASLTDCDWVRAVDGTSTRAS